MMYGEIMLDQLEIQCSHLNQLFQDGACPRSSRSAWMVPLDTEHPGTGRIALHVVLGRGCVSFVHRSGIVASSVRLRSCDE